MCPLPEFSFAFHLTLPLHNFPNRINNYMFDLWAQHLFFKKPPVEL
jgi:hypothetical protein